MKFFGAILSTFLIALTGYLYYPAMAPAPPPPRPGSTVSEAPAPKQAESRVVVSRNGEIEHIVLKNGDSVHVIVDENQKLVNIQFSSTPEESQNKQ